MVNDAKRSGFHNGRPTIDKRALGVVTLRRVQMDERDRKYSRVEKLVFFVHQITSNKLSGINLEVLCVY